MKVTSPETFSRHARRGLEIAELRAQIEKLRPEEQIKLVSRVTALNAAEALVPGTIAAILAGLRGGAQIEFFEPAAR